MIKQYIRHAQHMQRTQIAAITPQQTRLHNQRGFTLIELMLYAGLTAIMTSAIGSMLILSVEARSKHQVIEVVETSAALIVDDVMTTVRQSADVSLGVDVFGNPQITITTFEPATSPTIYTAQTNGNLTKTVGTADPVQLNPNNITITNPTAAIESADGETQKLLRFGFTASFDDATDRAAFQYSRDYTSAAMIRTP